MKQQKFLNIAKAKFLVMMLAVLAIGCKEKYLAPVPDVKTGFLVVEGVLSPGFDISSIRLTRSNTLYSNEFFKETGAFVQVISKSNQSSLILAENGEGIYQLSGAQFDTSDQYQLSIQTQNGQQFQSDFIKIKNNPPIDSISWSRTENGVQLYVNTHDPQNNTRYYQWDYDETWEFRSAYFATLKYVYSPPPENKIVNVVYRDQNDPQIWQCWRYNSSTSILLGSTAKLSEDKVHLPITSIENGAQRLSVRYSILVRQYAWPKEGYDFLERMKKNTESVGSIFDAQPSQLNGNIHCISDPLQPVIGFFNICAARQQRIFINSSELSGWGYQTNCQEVELDNNKDSLAQYGSGMLPTTPSVMTGPASILKFYAAPDACVDCRLTGSNQIPAYW